VRTARVSGEVVKITVEPSVAGRIYQLQASENLTAPSWQNLENEATGDGNSLSITTAHIQGAPRRGPQPRHTLGPDR
jgi:hypothetical protein